MARIKPGRPNTGEYIAYYRVSTDKQGDSGLGLEAQRDAVHKFLNGGDWNIIAEFTEIESGRKNKRPQLEEAIRLQRKTGAKIIVAKLDRLYRNAYFTLKLKHDRVDFIAADNPEMNSLTLGIMALMAEHEAELISERTKAALGRIKARGEKKLGSPTPEIGAAAAGKAVAAEADRRAENVLPLIHDLRRKGLSSYRDIAQALNARGIETARGGAWHASTVRNYELREKKNG